MEAVGVLGSVSQQFDGASSLPVYFLVSKSLVGIHVDDDRLLLGSKMFSQDADSKMECSKCSTSTV